MVSNRQACDHTDYVSMLKFTLLQTDILISSYTMIQGLWYNCLCLICIEIKLLAGDLETPGFYSEFVVVFHYHVEVLLILNTTAE